MSEFAWACGVFEGEGSVIQRGVTPGGNTRSAALTMTMTDEDIVRRVAAVFGCGSVMGPRQENPAWKPTWTWRVSRRADLLPLAKRMLRFAGARRGAALAGLLSNPPDHRRIIAETGFCKHGHNTSVVGLTTGGRCAECGREYSRQHRARERAS